MAMSRSFGSTSLTIRPPISMVPALGRSSPATILSSVDLPQPEGPTSTVNSPLSMSRSMPFNTSSRANRFERPRMLNAAMMTPSLHCSRGEATHEVASTEQIDQQRRQCRDQHRRALLAVHRLGGDCGRERNQRGGDRLLAAGGKGDAIKGFVSDPGELEDPRHEHV